MTPEPTSLTELATFLGAGGLVLWLLACLSVGALTVMLAKWWQWWHSGLGRATSWNRPSPIWRTAIAPTPCA